MRSERRRRDNASPRTGQAVATASRAAAAVEHLVGGGADGELVPQVAADPEPAAEAVVVLDEEGLDAGAGEAGDKSGRAGADNNAVALDVFLELAAKPETMARVTCFSSTLATIRFVMTFSFFRSGSPF